MNIITFEKAAIEHKNIIFEWLAEPHIKEFWDNTQAHKDDILNFMDGRKTVSSYCGGKYIYWIAKSNGDPFAMLMTIQETCKDHIDDIKKEYLSKTGHTYGLDYMIGNKNFLGKGYGFKTLIEFLDYFRKVFDFKADTFLIDPASDNPKAKHVYMKAGFKHVADFTMKGDCSGAGKLHDLLIKKFQPIISVKAASIQQYPLIQNMARFYVYDLSRECAHISADWQMPSSGLYESFDFKNYFEDESRKAYIINVYDEIAGFVLLNQITIKQENTWNMGEFFIIAKFQGEGIGKIVARKVWQMHPGRWEMSVIPENKSAYRFWQQTISDFMETPINAESMEVSFDSDQPNRFIFTFDTQTKHSPDLKDNLLIEKACKEDIYATNKLSYQKRRAYEQSRPQFWKWAGKKGEKAQQAWFKELLRCESHIFLVAKQSDMVKGFIIAQITSAPEVYNPDGLTLMVDDFCVEDDQWKKIGSSLVNEIKQYAKDKGVTQILVVCGAHDDIKRSFLKKIGLSVASEWYVSSID